MDMERVYIGCSITNESKRDEVPLAVWQYWTNQPGELGDNSNGLAPHKIVVEMCRIKNTNKIVFHAEAIEEKTGGVYFTNYSLHIVDLLALLAEGKKEVKHIAF